MFRSKRRRRFDAAIEDLNESFARADAARAETLALRGRVLQVGADWLRLEVVEDEGTLRIRIRRVHDVRVEPSSA